MTKALFQQGIVAFDCSSSKNCRRAFHAQPQAKLSGLQTSQFHLFWDDMPPRSPSNYSNGGGLYSSFSDNDDDDVSVLQSTIYDPKQMGVTTGNKRRGIRFAPNNEVFDIPHLNDMTDEDVINIWYQAEDYNDIKASYQLVIVKMESGEFREDCHQTCRGLEYRTQEGAWARYENKRDAYNAVLDEQDRQWKVDKDDHDKISSIYLQHSQKCADAAVVRAALDAKEAREICSDILKRRKVRKKKSRKDCEPAMTVPRVDDIAQVLQERSFSRRNEIRDDIKKQQAKALKKDIRKAVAV